MIPGMTICSAVQLRQSQSEEKWSGFTYFNASGDHFAKHQLSLTKRRACGFGVENGKRIVAVHKSAVRLPSSQNIPAHVTRFGLLPRTDIHDVTVSSLPEIIEAARRDRARSVIGNWAVGGTQ